MLNKITILFALFAVLSFSIVHAEEFVGYLGYSEAWTDEGFNNPQNGFYKFTSQGGTASLVALSDVGGETIATNAGVYANGKMYCYDAYGSWVTNHLRFHIINGETWTIEKNIYVGTNYTYLPCDMTYDYISDTFYAVCYNKWGNSETGRLCTVNVADGTMTQLAEIPFIRCIAADATGQLWGINRAGKLVKISLNGSVFEVGATGYEPMDVTQATTIDFRTGKMHWATVAYDASDPYHTYGYFELNEVDLTSGKLTKECQFDRSEEITCLSIVNAHPDALDNISEISFAPVGGNSTKGNISFTLPTKTYSQKPYTGSVNVDIYLDGVLVGTETVTSGATFTKEYDTKTVGLHKATIQTVVNGHKGVKASTSSYFGNDVPNAPSKVTLSTDAARVKAHLEWTAPTVGTSGGYIDENSITYDVMRYPDEAVVARNLTTTSFEETIDREMYNTRYTVVANVNGKSSRAGYSNWVKIGKPIAIPYYEPFDDEMSFNRFFVIDANGDGGNNWEDSNWKFDPDYYCAFYFGNLNKADDWLITPTLDLSTEYIYQLIYQTYGYYGYENLQDVTIGSEPTVAGQSRLLQHNSFYNNANSLKTYYIQFSVKPGEKYIGFHDCSTSIEHQSIDNIAIVQYCKATVPDVVTNLSASDVSYDNQTQVSIQFNAPKVAANGSNLTSKITVKIYRGSDNSTTPIYTNDNVTPGELVNFIDKKASPSSNTYCVVASNEEGEGLPSLTSIDLSEGVPGLVSNVAVKYIDNNTVKLTWSPATDKIDANGMPVDIDNLRYNVYKVVALEDILVATCVDGCEFIDSNSADWLTSPQAEVFYRVSAIGAGGEGGKAASNRIRVGTPYSIPFSETWEYQTTQNAPWTSLNCSMYTSWTVVSTGYSPFTLGNDGPGLVSMSINSDFTSLGSGSFSSPQIDFSETTSPVLSFWLYCGNSYGDATSLSVGYQKEGEDIVDLKTFYLKSSTNGWRECIVPLDGLQGSYRGSVVFTGGILGANNTIHLDKVTITADRYANNVKTVSIVAERGVNVNRETSFDVRVKNVGTNDQTNVKVELFADDDLVAWDEVEFIPSNGVADLTFDYIPTQNLEGLDVQIKAVVTASADEFDGDNTITTSVKILPSLCVAVDDLTGCRTDDGGVSLLWSAPSHADYSVQICDGAEEYKAFTISEMGQWSLYDGDKCLPFLFQDSEGVELTWDNNHELQAFMVFNAEAANLSLAFDAYQGKQCFVSWAAAGHKNNDWLISPELPAEKQIVSFYARGVDSQDNKEYLNVMVSYTDNRPESFIALNGDSPICATSSWTSYNFSLKEGAKYFAFNYVGTSQCGLMIDNVTYNGYPSIPTPMGYNVYSDGIKINDELVTATHWMVPACDALGFNHRYTVTAVYDNGIESPMSNELVISASGVESLSKTDVKVFATQGHLVVENAVGLIRVFNLCGQMIMQTQSAHSHIVIPVDNGIYNVVVGGKASKVVVK